MIYKNVLFHNTAQILEDPTNERVRLQRVPKALLLALNPDAQIAMLSADNSEIRFISDNQKIAITLSSKGKADVTVFHGLFCSQTVAILDRKPRDIEILCPNRVLDLDSSYHDTMSFHPRVFRFIFGGPNRDAVFFHNVKGDNIRPPKPNDMPLLRYLAYGTSITEGFSASAPYLS